jgi:molybdate transport system regulatory protein
MSTGLSSRNQFEGTITAVTPGAVNTEVAITTAGGDTVVAIVTQSSAKSLGLALGGKAVALVKAPWVILQSGTPALRFSARNQLAGTVTAVQKGAVNSEVTLTLRGGAVVHAVVTNESVADLGLQPGVPATALIKASHVVVGGPV